MPEHSGGRGSICICADDFGLYRGVNEAVFELAGRGLLQASGCMVGAPFWRGGGASLRQFRGLDVGLHLDFTEHPLLAPPLELRAVVLSSYFGRLKRARVRGEICAQLDAFEAVMWRPPAFVDGHQHVHALPVIRDELRTELERRYGLEPVTPWLRSTRRARGAGFKAWVIEQLGSAALARLAAEGRHAQNGRLLGVYDFTGGVPRYERLLAGWIAAAEAGDLLMCHPSRGADEGDPLGSARNAEFQVLGRPGFVPQLLDKAGLTVAPVRRS